MTQSTLAQTKKMNKSSKHTNFLKAEIQRSEVVTLQKVIIESTIKGNGVKFKKYLFSDIIVLSFVVGTDF